MYQHLLLKNCLRDHRYLPKEPLDRKLRNWNTHTLTTEIPSTDTVDSADEDESAGSASQQITDDETVQEDTLDMNTSQHTEEIENLNPVRRSTRERRQPTWSRSGEFDICKSAISTTADWEKKVTCILQLATNSPIFQTLQAEFGQAILSILSTSNTQS
jgi:hypothetical protein